MLWLRRVLESSVWHFRQIRASRSPSSSLSISLSPPPLTPPRSRSERAISTPRQHWQFRRRRRRRYRSAMKKKEEYCEVHLPSRPLGSSQCCGREEEILKKSGKLAEHIISGCAICSPAKWMDTLPPKEGGSWVYLAIRDQLPSCTCMHSTTNTLPSFPSFADNSLHKQLLNASPNWFRTLFSPGRGKDDTAGRPGRSIHSSIWRPGDARATPPTAIFCNASLYVLYVCMYVYRRRLYCV